MELKRDGRILYISSVDISVGNGPGVNEREFTLGLQRAIGERAHFLIPRPVARVPDLPMEACTFSTPHRRHHPWHFLRHSLSQMRLADRLLAGRRFDLLVFRLDVLPFYALYITRRHPVPYALKTLGQGMMNVLVEKGGLLGRPLDAVNRALVSRLVARSLVADSVSLIQVESLQSELSAPPGRIIWIDNAVNLSRFHPTPAEDARETLGLRGLDPIVGYIGGLPAERGALQIIEAAPGLLTRFPNLGVLIVGDGPGQDDLKRKAEELKLGKHCVFAGYVPLDRVPLYANALDVGVSISLRSDRRAASELKVRQYLACGKPVVASPGSNDFLLEEGLGSIVEPRDLAAIGAALESWLSLSDEERASFCRKASGYMASHLSMDSAIERRLVLWDERIHGRASHPTAAVAV